LNSSPGENSGELKHQGELVPGFHTNPVVYSINTSDNPSQINAKHQEQDVTMSFDYVLPTTGAVSFTSFISSPPARLHASLAEAAAHRGRLRDILKRLKRADDKDTLAVIKVSPHERS